jgi:hypothetical protein
MPIFDHDVDPRDLDPEERCACCGIHSAAEELSFYENDALCVLCLDDVLEEDERSGDALAGLHQRLQTQRAELRTCTTRAMRRCVARKQKEARK